MTIRERIGVFVLGIQLALFPQNRYEAATTWSASRSYVHGAVQDARLDLSKASREELMRKARYFEKNSELVNRMADVWEQYTVGQGLQFFPASSNPQWNEAAAVAWDQWKKFAAIDSLHGFDQLQGIISRACFIDGEVFVLKVRGETGRARIQLVESHRCKTPPTLQKDEGVSIIDGVEIDDNGRPIGYWFSSRSGAAETFTRFDADSVIHIFEPGRAGQYRGVTYLSCCLNTLHDLDDLQILEMQAAKRAARTTDVIQTATGELPQDAFRRARFGLSAAPTTTAPDANRLEEYQTVTGARPVVLRPGEEWKQYVSNRPSVVTQEYWKKLESKACVGAGIPYVLVYPESMQGTVYRGALDTAAAFFKVRSSAFAIHFMRIYEFAMESELRTNPTLRNAPADWRKADTRFPKAVNVDVGRNSSAMLAELAAGVRSHVGISAEDGGDWKQTFIQKATVRKFVLDLCNDPKYAGVTPDDLISKELPPVTEPQPEPVEINKL